MKHLPIAIRLYISCIAVLAMTILYHSIQSIDLNWAVGKAVIFFGLVSIVADSLDVDLPIGGHSSVNFAIDLACIVLFGPNVAIWVALCGELFGKNTITGRTPYYKILFNVSQFILSVWVAGMVYLYLGGKIGAQTVSSILPFLGASLTYAIINFSAVTVVLAITQKSSLWGIWLMNFGEIAPNIIAFTPLALLMAIMYQLSGVLGGILFFVPLLLARFIFKSYMDVRQNYLDTLGALASALDAKDRYTKGHSDRVSLYSVEVARALKLPEDKIEMIEHMALLHDIGKIGISGEILCLPGKLTDSQFDQIKQHPIIGANIIKNIHYMESAIDLVRYHHEKFNGTGYPYGLKGEQIPLEARIVTLADSFDAMTSDRSYRKAMTMEEALEEVKRSSGTHFDPEIVEAFLNSWENGCIPNFADEQIKSVS